MANIVAFGQSTTNAGTRKQVTTNSNYSAVNSLVVQALPTNTGNVYIGDSTVDAATGAGTIRILQPGEVFSAASEGLNDLDATQVYFDVESNGDGIVGGGLER